MGRQTLAAAFASDLGRETFVSKGQKVMPSRELESMLLVSGASARLRGLTSSFLAFEEEGVIFA